MARSLNKAELIGNLTRDPELRYTPAGAAVCTFGLATNRYWTTDSGEKREDVEFHRIVAWNKLAELCAQLLVKGRKVYVEGRLQTRKWTGQDGQERTTTEIVINDMIILDSRGAAPSSEEYDVPDDFGEVTPAATDGASGSAAAAKPTDDAKTTTNKPQSSKADDMKSSKDNISEDDKKTSKDSASEKADDTEGGEDIPF
jgi:single-strand DNA-binding protein